MRKIKIVISRWYFIIIEVIVQICVAMYIVDPSHLQEGAQPNIHPGCISSTGRGRMASSATPATQTNQIIGTGISPSLFQNSSTATGVSIKKKKKRK